VRDFWVFTPAETYFACISISAITEIQMETFATADPSHLFLTAGNHTLISSLTILQRDGRDLSSIRLTRPLLKGSMAYGLLLMAPPRSKTAGALCTILPWMMNVSFAHDRFPNLYFLS
jgi:hypothetical protein